MKILMRNSIWLIKTIKKYNMKKTFLLVQFLFLLAGVKAQQAKTKNTDVIEHREGNSPEAKKQQKQVKNNTQAFPKPVDSVRGSAKMRSVAGSQVILKPVDSLKVNRNITADKNAAAATQFIKGKISTKKPQQTTNNKPAAKQAAKRGE